MSNQVVLQRCVEQIMRRANVSEGEARRVLESALSQLMSKRANLAPSSLVKLMGLQKAVGDSLAPGLAGSMSSLLGGFAELPPLHALLPPLANRALSSAAQPFHSPPQSPATRRPPRLQELYQSPPQSPRRSPPHSPRPHLLAGERLLDDIALADKIASLATGRRQPAQAGSSTPGAFVSPSLPPVSLAGTRWGAKPAAKGGKEADDATSEGTCDSGGSSRQSRSASPVELLDEAHEAAWLLAEGTLAKRKREADGGEGATPSKRPAPMGGLACVPMRKTLSAPPVLLGQGGRPAHAPMPVMVQPGTNHIVDLRSNCSDGLLLLSCTANFVPRAA